MVMHCLSSLKIPVGLIAMAHKYYLYLVRNVSEKDFSWFCESKAEVEVVNFLKIGLRQATGTAGTARTSAFSFSPCVRRGKKNAVEEDRQR
jgi:hypothetical protein